MDTAADTTLWIEPFGGMAGDMFLAALLDLGDARLELAGLSALAERLVPDRVELALEETRRGSLRARLLRVRTPESDRAPHRGLSELCELLDAAGLSEAARARSVRVLERIARAEARVHGVALEAVHFHEVGAVDTLVDVAGAAWALERLGVERVAASPPLVGAGTVVCAHGELPVPAPGTAEILRGIPYRTGGGAGERVTPTGAALLAELAEGFDGLERFEPAAIGYGAGLRELDAGPPNLLRVQLGHAAGPARGAAPTEVWTLAFQVDDATGEEVAHCLERLRDAGALDAWSSPVQMKKGRPGTAVFALARHEGRAALERVAFDASSTLGVRWSVSERTECRRETVEVELDGRRIRVKRRFRPHAGGAPSRADLAPEYEDLAAWSRATGEPLRALERRAVEAALARLGGAPEPRVAGSD